MAAAETCMDAIHKIPFVVYFLFVLACRKRENDTKKEDTKKKKAEKDPKTESESSDLGEDADDDDDDEDGGGELVWIQHLEEMHVQLHTRAKTVSNAKHSVSPVQGKNLSPLPPAGEDEHEQEQEHGIPQKLHMAKICSTKGERSSFGINLTVLWRLLFNPSTPSIDTLHHISAGFSPLSDPILFDPQEYIYIPCKRTHIYVAYICIPVHSTYFVQ